VRLERLRKIIKKIIHLGGPRTHAEKKKIAQCSFTDMIFKNVRTYIAPTRNIKTWPGEVTNRMDHNGRSGLVRSASGLNPVTDLRIW
jgi:hypothetical protein